METTVHGDAFRANLHRSATMPRERAAVALINATSLPDDDRFGSLLVCIEGRTAVANWPTLLREPAVEMLCTGHQRMVWAAVTIAGGGDVDFDRACQPLDEENTAILRAALDLAATPV